jgi:hypothetical protein
MGLEINFKSLNLLTNQFVTFLITKINTEFWNTLYTHIFEKTERKLPSAQKLLMDECEGGGGGKRQKI